MKLSAVILAGGKSSRMGRDKALLPFKEFNSLAQYQYNRLSKLFDRVYISAKSSKFDFEAPLIIDNATTISSPMVALEAILSYIKDDTVFIIGVDMPFVSEATIKKMIDFYNSSDIEIAVAKCEKLEPLCAIYSTSLIDRVRDLIHQNNHRLQTLIEQSKIKRVKIDDIDEFLNLNRVSDYKNALTL